MARLDKFKERVHQPFFDSLFRGVGRSSVNNQFQLFGAANVGSPEKTNLAVPGVLASDATYLMKAMRCVMWFQSLADSVYNVSYGALTAITQATSDSRRAQDCYSHAAYGSYFTLTVGQKPMLNGPLWYVPAGGGIHGASTVNDRAVVQNGVQSQEAILKLAKDIAIAKGQNFNVQVNFFPFAILGTGGSGGTLEAAVNPLDFLNQFDGIKLLQIHIDGITTRDVQ